eukprot:SAG31_NODE_71_length_28115_cov_4.128105_13_plen_1544_part_00
MRDIPNCGDRRLTQNPFTRKEMRKYDRKHSRCNVTNPGRVSSFADVTYIHGDGSTQAMLDYVTSKQYGQGSRPWIIWIISFAKIPGQGLPGTPGDWHYNIHMNFSFGEISTGNTAPIRPLFHGLSTWYQNNYAIDGYMSMQMLVDRYIIHRREPLHAGPALASAPHMIEHTAGEDVATINRLAEPLRYAPQRVQHLMMPLHGLILNLFYEIVKSVFALLFMIMFMYPTFTMIASFVEEKETRVREAMRMMGVGHGTILGSWFGLYFILFSVLNLVLTIAAGWSIFEHTDNTLLFTFLNLYTCSACAFSWFIHVFFDKARTGGIAGALIFNCCYFVYAATFDFSAGNVRADGSLNLCLLSPAAFAYGISLLCQYEESAVGLHWSTLADDIGVGLTMWQIFYMLILDTVLYTLLGHYLDQVLPKEFGVRRSWDFPIQDLLQVVTAKRAKPIAPLADDGAALPPAVAERHSDDIEDVGLELRRQEQEGTGIVVKGLRKVFSTPDGPKVAVAGLNVCMYEGQIFVLLGHNGAGKTTTLNMLTGLYAPSAGEATVYGRSITTDMNNVRKEIGVCPQHDVLFASLTCTEHLQVFGQLKYPDATKDQLDMQIESLLKQVGIGEKAGTKAAALSGGMKRKLSLVIALIGGSKTIFLDEPTSGMDPYSRRSTWKFLRANRPNRSIILTTHFMDEADLLGDRIAIMAEGHLRCCGSALFLKNRFGSGYSLCIAKTAACQSDKITRAVNQTIPESILVSDVGSEIRFQLPSTSVDRYPLLFTQFDSERKQLGIDHYGVSVTTMEEVFLRVAEGEGKSENFQQSEIVEHCNFGTLEASSGSKQEFARHFCGLFFKRAQYGRRDRTSIICTTTLPVVLLLLGLLMLKFQNKLWQFKPAPNDFSQYVPRYSETVTVPYYVAEGGLDIAPGQAPAVALGGLVPPREQSIAVKPVRIQDLDLEDATGEVWGVKYVNGVSLQNWRPRADRRPDMDRRHVDAHLGLPTEDAEEILAVSQRLLATDYAANDPNSRVYGAVILSKVSDGHSVCGTSMLHLDHGIIFGLPQVNDCSMIVQAYPSKQLQLQFVQPPENPWIVKIYDGRNVSGSLLANTGARRWSRHSSVPMSSRTGFLFILQTYRGSSTTLRNMPASEPLWQAAFSSISTCMDQSQCGDQLLYTIEQFGFDCNTQLQDVDPDKIDPALLPVNPLTNVPFTQAEIRTLTDRYVPQLIDQYGGDITLSAVCPVTCSACDDFIAPVIPVQISEVQRRCNAFELQQLASRCQPSELLYFCSSSCFTDGFDPWLRLCATDDGLAALSDTLPPLLLSFLRQTQLCESAEESTTSPAEESDPTAGGSTTVKSTSDPESCWDNDYTSERCCAADGQSDSQCWSGSRTFSHCCQGVSDMSHNNVAYSVIFNGTCKHGNAVLQSYMSNAIRKESGTITTWNTPLPESSQTKAVIDSVSSLQAVLFIMIAFAFVPGGIVVFIVREKEAHHNSKHQQMVSGTSIPAYWLSSYAWDMSVYMLPLLLSMIVSAYLITSNIILLIRLDFAFHLLRRRRSR